MTLYVCRHGRTEANASGLLLGRANPDLDDTGRQQAAAIAAAIPQPATVISSPLNRCVQTAEQFGLPITVDERLIELDYGEFDLKPLADVPPEVWASWRSDADFRPPGGETFNELALRVNGALDDLREQAIDQDVVVVSHVSPIKAALAWALDCPISISWRCFVAQAAIMEIGVSKTGPSLRLFNGVTHLDAIDAAGSSPRNTGGR